MSYLRDLLQSHAPDLHAALENAWKVALHDVFPVLYSTDESLNSSPHSQNIENYLNSIYYSFQDICCEDSPYYLSPYELYAILMAILFHDIGRIMSEKGHGSFSKIYVKKNFEKFFIPNEELADVIGDICDYHKSLDPEFIPTSTLLDAGKGKIRTRELSELLILVDEMDTTYRRLKSLYVLDQPKYYTGKALFRNYIKGVCYNHSIKCVIVSIDNKIEENTDIDMSLNTVEFINSETSEEETDSEFRRISNDLIRSLQQNKIINIPETDNNAIWDILDKLHQGKIYVKLKLNSDFVKELDNQIEQEENRLNNEIEKEKYGLIKKIKSLRNVENKMGLYYMYQLYIKKGVLDDIMREIEIIAKKRWPIIVVLPTILSAISNCQSQTEKLDFMNRIGIHVKKWLICYKDHLYDVNGMETIEPILDYSFIRKVVKKMWTMSDTTFGDNWFSFVDLASKAHAKDINRLKLAVQRIEIITRDAAISKRLSSCINYDNTKWCWVRERGRFLSDWEVLQLIKSMEANFK